MDFLVIMVPYNPVEMFRGNTRKQLLEFDSADGP